MNSQEIIIMDKVCYTYADGKQKVRALKDISLTINKSEFVAITGPSGSGKTTLLQIMGCLLTPTSGSYYLLGKENSGLNRNEMAATRNSTFGFVFQNFNLLPRAVATQNVALPLIYSGITREKRTARAKEMLERVGLSSRISHRPNELSGGEQQRVAIARALATRPSILLADEPTGNLDRTTSISIMKLFKELVDEGVTVVFVSHDQEMVTWAFRLIDLVDGCLA